jgi:hypothetical protein
VAFLESGSGVIDAILTQAGRAALARNDGSFKITKFSFGDDEINYQLYDSNKSFDQDGDILNLPVLEPISDENYAQLYRLISLPKGTQRISTLNLKPTEATASYGDDVIISVETINGDDSQGYYATIRDTGIGVLQESRVPRDEDNIGRFVVRTGANADGKVGTTKVDIFGVNSGARREFTLTVSSSGTT